MGEVYLADDTKFKRKIALKFLQLHLYQNEDCCRRFTCEEYKTPQYQFSLYLPIDFFGILLQFQS